MISTSYHNHSNWSDGTSSIAEMFQAGKASGLREFGLSDHLVLHPEKNSDAASWGMKQDRLEDYVSEGLRWKNRLDDEHFTARLGLEVDFFAENYREVLNMLRGFPFDYLIGAVHYCGTFPIDHSPGPWQALEQPQIDEIWLCYWRKIRQLAATRSFDFLAHLDLPKKFCFLPSGDVSGEIEQTLLTLQKYDLPLEINTAGWSKPCADSYPGTGILTRAQQLGIPVLVNADAHQKELIQQFFPRAELLLRQCGWQQVCTFAGRQRRMIPF